MSGPGLSITSSGQKSIITQFVPRQLCWRWRCGGRPARTLVAGVGRSLVNCTPRVSIFTFISRVSTPVPQREGRCFRCSASLPSSEHGIIVERVKSGLSRAQSQGKRLGRRRVGENVVECIREQLATGAGILRTAKKPRSTAIFDQWSRSTACPTLAQAKRVLAQPVSKGTLISGSERLWRNIQVPSMLRCSLSAL